MKRELVIVIDFGGQYNQLVARRVRECNVYCEIYSYKTDIEKIKAMNPKGIILTGGPNSCYEEGAPTYKKELFELGIPVLGLCYGAQLMMHVLGGKVEKGETVRLCISVPPQHGKTTTITKTLPSWFVGRNIGKWAILTAYNADIAEKFGEKVGVAFQIIDDILDSVGDAKTLGKPVGSDEKNNKDTIAVRLGVEYCRELAQKYTDEAFECLEHFDGDTTNLKELATYLLKRDY